MKRTPLVAIIGVLIVTSATAYVATKGAKKTTQVNSASTTNQDTVEADGTIIKPDGTMIKVDGTMVKVDGTMVKPDGTMIKPDGTMVKVDGTMVKPDGTMIKPDGTMIGPDGKEVMENKNTNTTGATNSNTSVSAIQPAKYVAYSETALAAAEKVPQGDTILYFHANWCPICQVLDPDITKNISKLPVGLTILKVDYDKETALKKKYGVTYQHTFVQVDPNGNKLKLWSGSTDATAIVGEII